MNFIRTFESVCWVYIWFIMHTVYGHDLRKRTNGSSNLLVVFGNIGFKMCQKRCMNYADCDGINFKRSGFYCELVKNTTTATFVEDKEFIFSDADTFKVEDRACWPNPCSSGQKCIEIKSGKRICIQQPLQNVACGKLAFQYPEDSTYYYHSPAKYAIDGNLLTQSVSSPYNSEAHTKGVYWMVDLLDFYLIQKIEVFINDYGKRFSDVDIIIGDTNEPNQLCGHYVGPGGFILHCVITCQELMVGRFVKLELTTPGPGIVLHPNEVRVYAFI